MKKKEFSKIEPDIQELILEELKAISSGVQKLKSGPLNERAILLLLQDAIGTRPGKYRQFGLNEIKAVLAGMESLETCFVKRKVKQS